MVKIAENKDHTTNQGDQIGWIFAYWVIVNIDSFLKITKKCFDHILGYLFTNASGHPATNST
jgi:hypothetical protein